MSRYYVEINGVSSLTIEGLAIKTLPSIVKAPMRNLREEIDGRDGDIITNLGYGAYDKVLEIGLFGNYDVDKVIEFFNTEGTIVFSDEDNKVYNFKMLEQINYDKLQKFRQATITLHCQPFKYPLTETPVEITPSFVEDEAEAMSLINTGISSLEIDLKGNTSQTGTPTPTSPIPVNVVSGDNEVVICGKNLFNLNDLVKGRLDSGNIGYANGTNSITISGNSFTIITNDNWRGASTQNYINATANTRYFISYSSSVDTQLTFACYDSNKTWLSNASYMYYSGGIYYIDTPANTNYIRIGIQVKVAGTCVIQNFQFEKGNSATTYEPYTSQNYPLYLGVENLTNALDTSSMYNFTRTDNVYKTSPITNASYDSATLTFTNSKTITSNTTIYVSVDVRLVSGTVQIINALSDKTLPRTNGSWVNRPTISSSFQRYCYKFDVNANDTLTGMVLQLYNSSSAVLEVRNIMFSYSSSYSYTPYGTTPIELNKIGTYQDYIYKTDKWYLHKAVGKVVLNGSETYTTVWYEPSNNRIGVRVDINNADYPTSTSTLQPVFCTRYTANTQDNLYSSSLNIDSGVCIRANNSNLIIKNNTLGATATSYNNVATVFKNDITTNNMTVYYPLKTAVETEITNTTLINQLEALKSAMSYEGQTNISQVNNDKPFILSAKALQKGSNEGTINNLGNIYSKPIIDIEGTGVVDIYLNGTQVFQVDTTDVNEIVIDSGEMEAYDPNTNNLANRKVVGDYETFKVPSGTNTIKVEGAITTATISKYTRWL